MPSDPQTGSFNGPSDNHLPTEITPFGAVCENHLPRDVPPFSVPIENENNRHPLMDGPPRCTCGVEPMTVLQNFDPGMRRTNKNISFANSMEPVEHACRPELLTCVSEEALLGPCCQNVGNAMVENQGPGASRFKSYHQPCNQYNVISDPIPRPYFENQQFVPSFHTQSLPRRYFQTLPSNPRMPYNEIGSLPRGFSTQSCRRLKNSSAVSFSEPEGLARIGDQQYPPPSFNRSSPHHSSMLQYSQQSLHMQEHPPPIPPPGPRAPILRRPLLPTSRPPRQTYTVMEERTTSV